MSEEKINPDEKEGPIGGERLRAARRANDISLRDVAKELHLDEPKVRALEKNDFEVLGAPVFAKGHLRKYAELVGVPIDDIMADYYMMNRSSGAPPVVGPVRKQVRTINPALWIGAVLAIVVIAASLYWWFSLRSAAPVGSVEPAPAPFASEPQDAPPAAEQDAPAEPAPGLADTNMTADAAAAAVEEEETVAAASPAGPDEASVLPTSGLPQVTVDIAYAGDCWTEVSDGSGRRLFYDLGKSGRVVTLSGDAPLRVILGDSENVSITVDGRAWPIPASSRSGKLARLTIDSQ